MKNISKRKYSLVQGQSEIVDSYIPPLNAKLYIYEIGGNCAFHPDVKCQICFGDTECLFVTHGDGQQKVGINLVGDGITALKITLKNDSEFAETIGGYYKGHES